MNVTPTPGIAAAWSAAKVMPNTQPVQPEASQHGATEELPAEADKSPPAPEGQGTQVDVRA